MYLLSEKLTSTIAVYMILKRVLKPWTEWTAYKNGIIDDKGKRLRRPKTSQERDGWDILDRFCWSIKRLNTKYLGDSKFAYLFSLVYLMKEQHTFTITHNMDKYKSELDGFTANKQKILFDCFYEIEKSNLINESLDLKTNSIKMTKFVEQLLTKYMIEDMVGGEGTTVGDIAQFTPQINKAKIQKRIAVSKKRKIKRRI